MSLENKPRTMESSGPETAPETASHFHKIAEKKRAEWAKAKEENTAQSTKSGEHDLKDAREKIEKTGNDEIRETEAGRLQREMEEARFGKVGSLRAGKDTVQSGLGWEHYEKILKEKGLDPEKDAGKTSPLGMIKSVFSREAREIQEVRKLYAESKARFEDRQKKIAAGSGIDTER